MAENEGRFFVGENYGKCANFTQHLSKSPATWDFDGIIKI
jgi:hypothetical protein